MRAYYVSELEEGAGPKEDAVVSVFLHLQIQRHEGTHL